MDTTSGRGFSLLELLVALAIVGGSAAVALPAWNRLVSIYDLSASTRVIQSELQNIKIRAATENTSYRLAYSARGTSFEIQRDGKTWAVKSLPRLIEIISDGSVIFSPRGTASGNRVSLRNGNGDCRQIVVSPTGRVRTCNTRCGVGC